MLDDDEKDIIGEDGNLYSWNELENKFYAKYPPVIKTCIKHIKHFIDLFRHYKENMYYAIKDRIFPHNVIKIKTLNCHWHDRDYLLIHSMFQVLNDYVDKEKPFETIFWDHDEGHINAAKEIKALLHWWNYLRPCRKEHYMMVPIQYSDILNRACGEHSKAEKIWEKEDEEMMIRLIKIRRFLWT